MTVLLNRAGVAAAEGAAVNGSGKNVSLTGGAALGLIVTLTGAPTTYSARVVVEGSFDGTNWHKLVRFKDVTNTATGHRFVRVPSITAVSRADVAADTLGSAEATGTEVDTPWPAMLRASTRVDALSGGTTPTVSIRVDVESG